MQSSFIHKYVHVNHRAYNDQELHVVSSDSLKFSYEPKVNCYNRMTQMTYKGSNLQKLLAGYIADP